MSLTQSLYEIKFQNILNLCIRLILWIMYV
jgi:hypothetical protein